MMNKISNVNTTNPHNKVYINEAHLLVITIKHNTRKKLRRKKSERILIHLLIIRRNGNSNSSK